MKYVSNDGGRKAAGFKGRADDCVCVAIPRQPQRPFWKLPVRWNVHE